MRSIWLASAAVILSAGLAAAQTSSPAPTGAPNAPTETPAGSSASPGNFGTGSNTTDTHMGTSTGTYGTSGGSNTTAAVTAPAPTGAPQAPQETTNPKLSPGNAAPSNTATDTTASSSSTAPATSTVAETKPMHHSYGGMAVPANASADRYLHIASDAIKHHDKGVADDALSHAETRLLTRAVPASDNMTDDSPRISSIEDARKALASGDYQTAAMDTRQAMHGHMGAMSNDMGGMGGSMGAMNAPSTTSDQPMPGSPMSNDSASGTSAGNGK